MDLDALHASPEAMEDAAEEYLLGRMSHADLAAYQLHLSTCEACRDEVEAAADFITLFRAAVSPQRPDPRVN
jgi:predicted anti-sigma-YlaC factor YlaD